MIDSDLDDSDDELRDEGEEEGEGEIDIVFCVYDKVRRAGSSHSFKLVDSYLGSTGQEQVEDGVQGWNDSCQWARLSICQVQRVRLHTYHISTTTDEAQRV